MQVHLTSSSPPKSPSLSQGRPYFLPLSAKLLGEAFLYAGESPPSPPTTGICLRHPPQSNPGAHHSFLPPRTPCSTCIRHHRLPPPGNLLLSYASLMLRDPGPPTHWPFLIICFLLLLGYQGTLSLCLVGTSPSGWQMVLKMFPGISWSPEISLACISMPPAFLPECPTDFSNSTGNS